MKRGSSSIVDAMDAFVTFGPALQNGEIQCAVV